MENSEKIKELVTERYSQIATDDQGCCGSACGCSNESSLLNEEYQNLEGYAPESDLGLGCGIPTNSAKIERGDVVVDLGSGAGNDCFVARSFTGAYGKVIGVDFTDAMIEKARKNVATLGYKNIHFVKGDIENLPLDDNLADVVISNCVFNLVPDKKAAFNEMHRILKPKGRFSISDIVVDGDLPDSIKKSAEFYTGCISGASPIDHYIEMLEAVGFSNIKIEKQIKIDLPSDQSTQQSSEAKDQKENVEVGIYSITVSGEKSENCCDTDCCN